MAGWTFTVGPTAPGLMDNNYDGGEKVSAFPAVPAGNAAWWREFVWRVRQEFAKMAQLNGPVPRTVTVSANNGNGDASGIGTLTITIVTA